MAQAGSAVLYGAIGSILAFALIAVAARTRVIVVLLGSTYRLAQLLRSEGITKFHRSRDDYGRTLRTYLSQAKHSITIISISMRQTHDEADLIGFFQQRLIENPSFRIAITLLAPHSDASRCAALSLNVPHERLNHDITHMLRTLASLKSSLSTEQQPRLQVLVHESFPMGSAILLDASPTSGTIQIETKLHASARVDSFGLEIVGPSAFYERHFRSWTGVVDESRTPTVDDLRP